MRSTIAEQQWSSMSPEIPNPNFEQGVNIYAGDRWTVTFTLPQASTELIKSIVSIDDINGNGIIDIGDKVNYSFLVNNTGGTPLQNISITDPIINTVTCPVDNLLAGTNTTPSITCTGSYIITADDFVAG